MIVKLDLSPESDLKVNMADDGKTPVSIEFKPFFATPAGDAVVAYGCCLPGDGTGKEDDTLDQFTLSVNGKTGKIAKKSRTSSVKPLCDMTPAERAAVTKTRSQGDPGSEEDSGS